MNQIPIYHSFKEDPLKARNQILIKIKFCFENRSSCNVRSSITRIAIKSVTSNEIIKGEMFHFLKCPVYQNLTLENISLKRTIQTYILRYHHTNDSQYSEK